MTKNLENLRSAIDAIDSEIHGLLMRRAEVVQEVGEVKAAARKNDKKAGSNLRVDRECTVIKKRLLQHKGNFPVDSLLRIWREIISASLRIEGDFAVSVRNMDGSNGRKLMKTVYDYFGSYQKVYFCQSDKDAVEDVIVSKSAVAVLPLLPDNNGVSWWCDDNLKLKVTLRIPLIKNNDTLDAFVLTSSDYKNTDHDRTLLRIVSKNNSSIDITKVLSEHGIDIFVEYVFHTDKNDNIYIVSVDDYFSEDKIKKEILLTDERILELGVLGWYPVII